MLIDLMTATGADLDVAGEVHKKPRRNGEADDAYRERLIDETQADGGAAFGEFKQVVDCSIKTGGISVRDYFAAKAIQGMFANDAIITRYGEHAKTNLIDPDVLAATAAYSIADAMLAERAK